VGFSVNPEMLGIFSSKNGSEKIPLSLCDVSFSGSSGDVAIALHKLGEQPLLLGLVGPDDCMGSQLLKIARKRSPQIPFTPIRALDETSISFLPIDESLPFLKNPGKRGEVLSEAEIAPRVYKVKRVMREQRCSWAVATGVRIMEIPFAEALLGAPDIAVKVFGPHRTFCERCALEPKPFHRMLGMADIFVLNQDEFTACGWSKLDDVHQFGPKLVVVTQADQGGVYSLRGSVGRFEAFKQACARVYPIGAGDWFLGALVKALVVHGEEPATIKESILRECLRYAAKAAGIKVTIPGSSRGPNLREV